MFEDVPASAKPALIAGGLFLAGAIMPPALLFDGIDVWAGWLLGVIFVTPGGGLLLRILPRLLF